MDNLQKKIERRPRTSSFHFSLEAATVETLLRVLLISCLGSFWTSNRPRNSYFENDGKKKVFS